MKCDLDNFLHRKRVVSMFRYPSQTGSVCDSQTHGSFKNGPRRVYLVDQSRLVTSVVISQLFYFNTSFSFLICQFIVTSLIDYKQGKMCISFLLIEGNLIAIHRIFICMYDRKEWPQDSKAFENTNKVNTTKKN